MKTTSAASALALSGLLLGLPMAQGRGGSRHIITKVKLDENGAVAFGQELTQGKVTGFNDLRPQATRPEKTLSTGEGRGKVARPENLRKPETLTGGLFAAPEKADESPDEIVEQPETRSGGLTAFGNEEPLEITGSSFGNDQIGFGNLGRSSNVVEESGIRAGGFPGLNPGLSLRNGGSADSESDGDEVIPFYCNLEIEFFKDQGKEPTEEEVKELISKTDDWLSEVFEIDPTFAYIMEEETNAVYDANAPDHFYVEFSSVVHADHAESDYWEIDIADISTMVDHADYELYITHFIWDGEPQNGHDIFQFFETQQVTLGCWRGERPVATGRRRLGGVDIAEPAFGGSHKVARH